MAADRRRRGREGERGQVLVVFILIFTTCVLLAIVAISAGQMLVRRHQAQMVVDAAAFSGAAAQARGLNTIARFNEKGLHLLRAIQETTYLPYMDSNSTTWERLLQYGIANDWAGDVLEDYQNIFTVMNAVIDGANLVYSPLSPVGPTGAAYRTVNENFSTNDESIFTPEDLVRQSPIIGGSSLWRTARLVELTDPEDYSPGLYWYIPYIMNPVMQTCLDDPEPFTKAAACGWLGEAYSASDTFVAGKRLLDPIEYQTGRFYDNPEGDDVRYAYMLTVSRAPVLFGQNFFDDLPDITVGAAAKPYGGYLGEEYEKSTFGLYDTPDGQSISPTYQAKLVPLTGEEVLSMAVLSGDPINERWLPWNVLH